MYRSLKDALDKVKQQRQLLRICARQWLILLPVCLKMDYQYLALQN